MLDSKASLSGLDQNLSGTCDMNVNRAMRSTILTSFINNSIPPSPIFILSYGGWDEVLSHMQGAVPHKTKTRQNVTEKCLLDSH